MRGFFSCCKTHLVLVAVFNLIDINRTILAMPLGIALLHGRSSVLIVVGFHFDVLRNSHIGFFSSSLIILDVISVDCRVFLRSNCRCN